MINAATLRMMKRFGRDTRAVTAIEYSLIATLIGVVIIVGASTIGTTLNTTFTSISTSLAGTSAEAPPP